MLPRDYSTSQLSNDYRTILNIKYWPENVSSDFCGKHIDLDIERQGRRKGLNEGSALLCMVLI